MLLSLQRTAAAPFNTSSVQGSLRHTRDHSIVQITACDNARQFLKFTLICAGELAASSQLPLGFQSDVCVPVQIFGQSYVNVGSSHQVTASETYFKAISASPRHSS